MYEFKSQQALKARGFPVGTATHCSWWMFCIRLAMMEGHFIYIVNTDIGYLPWMDLGNGYNGTLKILINIDYTK